MGFSLLKWFRPKKIRPNGEEEFRASTRYNLWLTPIAFLTLENGKQGQIIDLSYGGAGVLFNDTSNIPPRSLGSIHCLGKKIECEMSYRHTSKGLSGIQFVHSSDEILNFLRHIIEFLRQGAELKLVRHVLAPMGPFEGQFQYVGDDATNLFFHLKEVGGAPTVVQSLIRYRFDKTICMLSYRGGEFDLTFSGADPYRNCKTERQKKVLRKSIIKGGILVVAGNTDQRIAGYSRFLVNEGKKCISR